MRKIYSNKPKAKSCTYAKGVVAIKHINLKLGLRLVRNSHAAIQKNQRKSFKKEFVHTSFQRTIFCQQRLSTNGCKMVL